MGSGYCGVLFVLGSIEAGVTAQWVEWLSPAVEGAAASHNRQRLQLADASSRLGGQHDVRAASHGSIGFVLEQTCTGLAHG